jgi:hypothetical protein
MNNDMFLAKLINMNYDEFFVSSSIDKFWYVKKYMEKEMPEVWERYLKEQAASCAYAVTDNMLAKNRYYTRLLNLQIDPSELVSYLSEHREWGVRHCSHCKRGEVQMHYTHPCEQCGGIGGKHLALIYLEESCEK